MFYNIKIYSFIFGCLMLASCNISPKEIEYGKDNCEHCLMSIVDKMHACELVTTKGKAYKFDSMECLVLYKLKEENSQQEYKFTVTNTYDNSTEFKNAVDCTYLISAAIKSPMGANLTAFFDKNKALEVQKEKSGDLLTWEQLQEHFKK